MISSKCMIFICILVDSIICWEVPELPSGKRSEYYLQDTNGGYKYGFDSGDGFSAKQTANENNEVKGHFSYPSPEGKLIDVKYTAGVQGYIPEGSQTYSSDLNTESHSSSNYNEIQVTQRPAVQSIDTSNQEAPSERQNKYYQQNNEENQGISSPSNDVIGYVESGSSQSIPVQITNNQDENSSITKKIPNAISWYQSTGPILGSKYQRTGSLKQKSGPNPASWDNYDSRNPAWNINLKTFHPSRQGSYNLDYNNALLKSSFSHDINNFNGRNSYINEINVPNQNLHYSNQFNSHYTPNSVHNSNYPSTVAPSVWSGFTSIPISSTDPNLGVKSLHPENQPNPSLTGFTSTPKSVDSALGVKSLHPENQQQPWTGVTSNPISTFNPDLGVKSLHPENIDSSYSFKYNTDHSARHESSDPNGNIHGKYSYTDEAGVHDLSYIAGDKTGFVVTGGSLGTPTTPIYDHVLNSNQQDGGYSVSHSNNNNFGHGTFDASSNIHGQYNNHDTTHNNGNTGFLVTGGSLGDPIGINTKSSSVVPSPYIEPPITNSYLPPFHDDLDNSRQTYHNILPSAISYTVNHDVQVNKYLPPDNEKVGYVFQSKYYK